MHDRDAIALDRPLMEAAKNLGELMSTHGISLYITGLAASGKTTVATYVSQITGIPLVDTGLPFRLATYIRQMIPASIEDRKLFDNLLQSHEIRIVSGQYRVFSGSVDITDRLRTPEIDIDTPRVSADQSVRERVIGFLKKTTVGPAIVAARGVTEPVTGGHIVQIELSASLACRVERRRKQEQQPSETVKRSIKERDRRDLRGAARYPSPDIIDTTHLNLDESLARLVSSASDRIRRLYSFQRFRRIPLPPVDKIENPYLASIWRQVRPLVEHEESRAGVPIGQTKAKFLLRLSRFSANDLFDHDSQPFKEWQPGTFPDWSLPVSASINMGLVRVEIASAVNERRSAIDQFFRETLLPTALMEAANERIATRTGGKLVVNDRSGVATDRLILKDASPELGRCIEKHLHYLGSPRTDATHRIVLAEASTDLPVLYMSFAPNTRKYTEPLLWSLGLRMEEVVVAVRGYGTPRCPKNGMSLFLRLACNKVAADFPHVRAILTDINPNWSFGGSSFREADFVSVGLKHAPTSFVGEEYTSRRALSGRSGAKAASSARIPLVPTLIMLRATREDDALKSSLRSVSEQGLYLIPRNLYDRG